MRVAFFVNDFPALTQNFILEQIAGVIDAGHDVTIIAKPQAEKATTHPLVEKHAMLSRTRYFSYLPFSFRKRFSVFGKIAAMNIPADRFRVVRSALNPLKYIPRKFYFDGVDDLVRNGWTRSYQAFLTSSEMGDS